MLLVKHLKTAQMTSQNLTNGGIMYLALGYMLRIVYVIPLLLLWRSLMAGGVEVGMSLSQMLTYTFLGTILSDVLVVRTPASNWLYEGLIISLYQRPMGIFSHLMAQTVGNWIPDLLFFATPMALAAPLFGVTLNMGASSLWFVPSLLLCVSLGFAVDFIFACLTIRMRNASWLVYSIRGAVIALLSGSVIPFAILPFGLGRVFQFLPLGSLAGAPLSIYTGLANAGPILMAQIFWNLTLWPVAIVFFADILHV